MKAEGTLKIRKLPKLKKSNTVRVLKVAASITGQV
jgi:hypothetical protein